MDIKEVKKSLNKKVIYNGKDDNRGIYLLTGCTIRKRNGELYYQAEIADLKSNSVIIANLSKIEVIENEDMQK